MDLAPAGPPALHQQRRWSFDQPMPAHSQDWQQAALSPPPNVDWWASTSQSPTTSFPASSSTPSKDPLECYWAILCPTTGRFLFVDPLVETYLGAASTRLLGSSVLDFVHLEDREAMADVLTGRASGLQDVTRKERKRAGGVLGTSTRLQYAALSHIRSQLECSAQEDALITYQPLRVVTSWIGETDDSDQGAILAFFHSDSHAETSIAPHQTGCGGRTSLDAAGGLDALRSCQLAEKLSRTFSGSKSPSAVFQILDGDGKLVFTSGMSSGSYDAELYATLAREVIARPRPSREASCQKRFRAKHVTEGRRDMPHWVESYITVHRDLTFACFRATVAPRAKSETNRQRLSPKRAKSASISPQRRGSAPSCLPTSSRHKPTCSLPSPRCPLSTASSISPSPIVPEYDPTAPFIIASSFQPVQRWTDTASTPSTSPQASGSFQPYQAFFFDEQYRPTVAQDEFLADEYPDGCQSPPKGSRRPRLDGGPPILKRGEKACETCNSTESPEWRKGPSGAKSLCNACGLRYGRTLAKAAKKAAALAGVTKSTSPEQESEGSPATASGSSDPTDTLDVPRGDSFSPISSVFDFTTSSSCTDEALISQFYPNNVPGQNGGRVWGGLNYHTIHTM